MRRLLFLAVFLLSVAPWRFDAATGPYLGIEPGARVSAGLDNDAKANLVENNFVERIFNNLNQNENDDGGKRKQDKGSPLPAPVSVPSNRRTTSVDSVVKGGTDQTVALADSRVAVRVFPAMAQDVVVGISLVAPPAAPPLPAAQMGNLVFRVDVGPLNGGAFTTLPAEVHLSVRYADADLGGRDEAKLTIGWLDPSDNQWKPAPKQAADAKSNYLAATVMNGGIYAVYQVP